MSTASSRSTLSVARMRKLEAVIPFVLRALHADPHKHMGSTFMTAFRRLVRLACLLIAVQLYQAGPGLTQDQGTRPLPDNATKSRYGGGWDCNRGFIRQ